MRARFATTSLMRHVRSIWRVKRIEEATVVTGGVPPASLPPFAPGDVIVRGAEGISRLYGGAIKAFGGVDRMVDIPRHCRCCGEGKNQSRAENFEFHHVFPQSDAGCEHTISARLRRADWAGRFLNYSSMTIVLDFMPPFRPGGDLLPPCRDTELK